MNRAIVLGLLLCTGEERLKVRVLYDVLQDNMQDQISAGDKDFKATFKVLVELSCYLIPDMFRDQHAGL